MNHFLSDRENILDSELIIDSESRTGASSLISRSSYDWSCVSMEYPYDAVPIGFEQVSGSGGREFWLPIMTQF